MSWVDISKQEGLSEDFILEHLEKIDLWEVLQRKQVSSSFLDAVFSKHAMMNPFELQSISKKQQLEPWFVEKYADRLYWYDLSSNPCLTESLISKFEQKVDWFTISMFLSLSEPFIERYKDKLSWASILRYQKLSLSFIKKYEDEMDWELLLQNEKIPENTKAMLQNRGYTNTN